MRILVLSQYWMPENGVPQRRWAWLTKILVREGHEVTVIAPPPHYQRKMSIKNWWSARGMFSNKDQETGPFGETILRSGFFPAGHSLTERIFNQASVAFSMLIMSVNPKSIVKQLSPDLVIGTVPALPTATVTRILAKRLKAPYIIDLRDAWPDLLRNNADWNRSTGKPSRRQRILSKGPLQLLIKITEASIKRSLTDANGIITTSERLAHHLEGTLPRETHEREILAIRNVFPPKSSYVRTKRAPSSKNQLHVLYAGTIGRAQKLENALSAARLVRDQGYDIQLRFLGDGATWNALRDQIKIGEDFIQLLHRVNANELTAHYDWADTALVHLTDWEPLTRTIPSKAYELMSVGLHITAVVEGEAAHLVKSLNAGEVVQPEDPKELAKAWIHLIENPSELNVSNNGRQWVEHQRNVIVPQRLLNIVTRVAEADQM